MRTLMQNPRLNCRIVCWNTSTRYWTVHECEAQSLLPPYIRSTKQISKFTEMRVRPQGANLKNVAALFYTWKSNVSSSMSSIAMQLKAGCVTWLPVIACDIYTKIRSPVFLCGIPPPPPFPHTEEIEKSVSFFAASYRSQHPNPVLSRDLSVTMKDVKMIF